MSTTSIVLKLIILIPLVIPKNMKNNIKMLFDHHSILSLYSFFSILKLIKTN